MGDVRLGQAAEPDGAPRIATLDILRGIAILGILFMNINSMGAAMSSHNWPMTVGGGWTLLDQIAWYLRMVLADGTARCLLELLFGAGMVILTGRVADRAGRWAVMGRYYWRNIVLFGFGMAHVFLLLWPGDILHTYAVAALIVFPFRKLPARWLIPLGLSYACWVTVAPILGIQNVVIENARVADAAVHRSRGEGWTPAERAAMLDTEAWHRQIVMQHRAIAREDRNRSRDFTHWARTQIATWYSRIHLDNWQWWLGYFGEAAGTMLIGAGLFKRGILQGGMRRAFYARMWLLGWLLGGAIRAGSAWTRVHAGDDVSFFWAFDEVGRLAMTLGHVGAINWLLGSAFGARALAPFSAAGRTALSVYIAQTLVCLWLLYPPFMLGLYGTQGWAALMASAAVIDLGLLAGANWWVRRFDIAPVEWLWRSIAAFRVLPFRRRRMLGQAGPGGTEPLPA